jgi:ribosomal protein L12E/L44/L45/RPP1/RPP2
MSEIIKLIQELLAFKDAIKEEITRPIKQELLSVLYDIKITPEEVNLDKMLKEYEAKDLLDLIRKIRAGNK